MRQYVDRRAAVRKSAVGLCLCASLLVQLPIPRTPAEDRDDARPEEEYTQIQLTLDEAGEKGLPLVLSLHARDDVPTTGWATVGVETGFIPGHDLRRGGDLLHGRLSVDVGPLQYVCDLAASVVSEELVGTYTGRRGIVGALDGLTGAARGKLSASAEGGDLRVDLHLWSMYTEFGHIRQPTVQATVRDGRITEGSFEFGRKPENSGKLEGGALRVEDGRLHGSIRATVVAGDAAHGTYTFTIDAPVRSNFLQGRYTTMRAGDNWGSHGFTGEVCGLADPEDAGVLVLTLDGGIAGDRPLTLYLDRKGQRFTGGMARGGNSGFHPVDASRLCLSEGSVDGVVGVTLLPEGDYPPGGRIVECEYTVHSVLQGGEAIGAFSGRYGVQDVLDGPLNGRILKPHAGGGEPVATDPDPDHIYPPEQAVRIGWPALAGPYGTFLPVRTDIPLVDDVSRGTFAWVSENADLGIGKQGTPFHKSFQSGERVKSYLGRKAPHHPGNWAGVIAADGRVFAASFRPTGPYFECGFPDGTPAEVRVDAEDFVVAMDFHTGRTLWLAAERGGMLTGGGKRAGFQVAPVTHGGRVFAMGSTGRLFAYDATTGRKLWQSDIGEAHRRVAEERTRILAGLAEGKFSFAKSPAWHTSLTVAGDTLVVPTFVKGTLRGLEAATGKKIWEAVGVGSHLVTPSTWHHGDREYILSANTTGEMRLIDPRNGRELWKVDGLGGCYFTLSPSPTHVLVNVNPESGKHSGGVRIHGFYGAYRITPEEATPAWKMPFEPRNGFQCWMDSEARYRYTVRDGLAYLYTDGAGREVPGRFLVVRQDTGKILAEHLNAGDDADRIGGLWYLMGDKVITRWDANHGPRHGGRHPWKLWKVSPSGISRLPGSLDRNEFTNGYEVNMEHPVIAGFLLERNEEGRVVCYDLRSRR